MSRSTISTFKLFELFPDEPSEFNGTLVRVGETDNEKEVITRWWNAREGK